jgi:vitamin B12 transporter
MGRVGGTTHLFNDRLETGLFLGQLQDDRRYLEPLAPADPNQASSDSRYHSYETDLQWNNILHLDDIVNLSFLSASAMTFGYEYTADTAKVRVNEDFAGLSFTQGATAYMTTNAAYAGLQTTVLQRLALTAQIRQDWVINDAPTTWRLGSVYDLKEIATHLKVAYGTAFRAPSLFDRYGVNSFGFTGNPNLTPEQSQGWEAGFTTDVPIMAGAGLATIGATYFDTRIRDLIVGVETSATSNTEINLASAHVHGVEVETNVHPVRWLDLHASYTLLNTTSDGEPAGEGSRLLRRPQNQASADVTIRPLPGWSVITTLLYTGSAPDFLIDNSGNSSIEPGIGQHGLIANIAINYAVTPRLELYLDGWNIFYSKFEPVNGYEIPGPTVLAGVRVKL